ncbi:MAG TPA: bifunctional (p)ppGpp synthetase/guanosine-3',5'-bis(diphosphate) 3'-pyrophosphohydrolase [Candidatus Uhrbacteria bacterium]|nr:bifunctional (p)ppGpp synthetase/guanosine-3',5'-bis(diphosphate) 3'-pyrophosphohydrolase [Candidatus Uhrbacteria bacterium]
MKGYWTIRIREALILASNWHDGQRRKEAKVPYNAHLWGVSLLLALSGADEDTIIAGVFHDILEDTPLKPELISWQFGEKVLEMVLMLTEPQNLSWEKRKEEMLRRIVQAPLNIKMIKCADKLDNLQSFFEATLAEGFRQGCDNSQARVWKNFKGGYEKQKWYNQEILRALFANVPIEDLPDIFGTYMRLVELVFGEKIIIDESVREKIKSS